MLADRLRHMSTHHYLMSNDEISMTCNDAAEEIERLEAELEMLQRFLRERVCCKTTLDQYGKYGRKLYAEAETLLRNAELTTPDADEQTPRQSTGDDDGA